MHLVVTSPIYLSFLGNFENIVDALYVEAKHQSLSFPSMVIVHLSQCFHNFMLIVFLISDNVGEMFNCYHKFFSFHFYLNLQNLLSCGKHLVISGNEPVKLCTWVISVSQCHLFEIC